MQSKKLGQLALAVLGLIIGIYAVISILLNPTGGISGLSKLWTIVGLFLGLVNPKAGLFFLAGQVMYSDEIKRLAVYYGVTSELTVSEVLIGPLLSICAINASFLYGVLQGRYTLGRVGWALYGLVPVMALASLGAKGSAGAGGAIGLYGIATFALYITLIPVCFGLFKNLEEWAHYISWQAVLAVPSAAWGIWQYHNGFNNIEWTYALSGLSPAHSSAMLGDDDPRIFGLFGTTAALSCVAMYCVFSFWHAFRWKKNRLAFLLMGSLFMVTAFYSQSRGILLYPFIAAVAIFLYRRPSTTILLYGTMITVFALGVLNASFFLNEGMNKINDAIATEGRWGRTLTVNTMSDRLRGWERLGKSSSWSLFGTGEQVSLSGGPVDVTSADYNHDAINKILIQYGAVGLISGLLGVFFALFLLHRAIFLSRDQQIRRDGAFVMGCAVPSIFIAAALGDNLSASVVSFQLWTIFCGVFIMGRLSKEEVVEKRRTRVAASQPALLGNIAKAPAH